MNAKTCGLAPLTPEVALLDIPRREHPMYVLTDIQRRWPALAKVVEEVPWVADGVDWSEKWTARNLFEGLHTIADRYGVQEALRVTKMPFFATLSPEESGAVYTLSNLIEDSPRQYRRLLDHPALTGGITDYLAKVIPMLDHVDAEDWNRVLQSASVEDRTIMLPLAGETNLTIVRIQPGLKSRMDQFEYAVRLNECVMGIPFPHRQVTVLNVPTDAGGFYEVTYIGINESLDKEYDDLASLLVHEAAHAYFSADVDWIVEGAATFMQLVDGLLRPDTGYAITNRCADASSVSAFDRAVALDPDFTDKTACHYSLGAAVFWDLFRYLELEAFALGFRKLYLASKQVDDSEFVIVREAFGRSAAAELVLDLYYDGAVKFAQLRGDHAHPRGVPNVQRYISFLSVADGSSGYSPLVSIDEIPANADLRFSFNLYNEDLSEQGDVTQITESIDLIVYFEDGVELEQSEPEIYDFDLTYGRLEFVWHLGTPNGEALKPGSYYAYLYRDGKKIGQTWFYLLSEGVMSSTTIPTLTPQPTATPIVFEATTPDQEALVALYRSTDGANWNNNTNWLSDEPLNRWYGVEAVGGRVTKLDLGDNGLRGEIPSEIGNLTQLRELWLGNNNLTGDEIPKEISDLKRLEILDLGVNEIRGTIPEWLGDLGQLHELHLDNNRFDGEVPEQLGNLAGLGSLTLQGNRGLLGRLPETLTKIENFWRLRFNGTGLCAPVDEDFQTWLRQIPDRQGPNCP